MADRVGQQLGNYLITRSLGQGGFAEVYLGQHIYLKTEAAIKVLQAQLSGHDMEDFVNEARTIASLIHPNIVRVLEFGMDGNTPFLVMDYAPNGTLRQRHPKGTRLTPDIILPYVKQISTGLQYAHNQKLIHRDIKPENLLVGRHDEILLSDFGVALVAQSSRYQSTQDVVGTVAYMSPEQIQGKPRPASDQYALGIVVYEWLSGDRPFRGSFTELCTQHMFAPPPPLRERAPTISPEIEQVVNTALAKDPKERFTTVQAFANALEQASLTPREKPALERSVAAPPPTLTATVPAHGPVPVQPALTATSPAALNTPNTSMTPPAFATPATTGMPPYSRQPASTAASTPSAARRVNLAPLGLVAFAISAFLLGALNTNLITAFATVAYLLAFCGLIQIISGIQELRTGNNFTATVLCSYGAFWLSFGFLLMPLFSGRILLDLIGFSNIATSLGFFLLS
jgi:serine/threonine protein kinase